MWPLSTRRSARERVRHGRGVERLRVKMEASSELGRVTMSGDFAIVMVWEKRCPLLVFFHRQYLDCIGHSNTKGESKGYCFS